MTGIPSGFHRSRAREHFGATQSAKYSQKLPWILGALRDILLPHLATHAGRLVRRGMLL
jgi:hypothetical protein